MESNIKKSPEYSHLSGVERWLVFSSNPRTEAEIEEELLTRPDDVCLSYVCTSSKMSTEFIERLIVLSTGALTKENLDKDFKTVEDLLKYKYSKTEDMAHKSVTLHRLNENNLPMVIDSKTLDDRIDWKAITMYQKLNNDFILKYADFLDKQYILSNMLLHPDVEKALRAKMPVLGPKGKKSASVEEVADTVELEQSVEEKTKEEKPKEEKPKLLREKNFKEKEKPFKEKEQSSILKSFTESILAIKNVRESITNIENVKKTKPESEFDKIVSKKRKPKELKEKTPKETKTAKSNETKKKVATKKASTNKKSTDDSKVVTMPKKERAKKK